MQIVIMKEGVRGVITHCVSDNSSHDAYIHSVSGKKGKNVLLAIYNN